MSSFLALRLGYCRSSDLPVPHFGWSHQLEKLLEMNRANDQSIWKQ